MRYRRALLLMTSLNAVSAAAGGIGLIRDPSGQAMQLPRAFLQHTPFASYLIPGAILLGVVGATSALAAFMLARRSPHALPWAVIAGAVLTVWIAAEIAIMRQLHWLHIVYGALGLGMLGLALRNAWATRASVWRWLILVTGFEAIGYLGPAMAGIFTARAGIEGPAQAAIIVAASAFEGLMLGTGQALAMPFWIRRRQYIAYTVVGVMGVWAAVMTAMLAGNHDPSSQGPGALVVGAGVLAGVIGLIAVGGMQWLELRHRVLRAHRFIAWTAFAWVLALPLSFLPGPFVDEQTPLVVHLVLWELGGLAMAAVMAMITWLGVRRLQPISEPG